MDDRLQKVIALSIVFQIFLTSFALYKAEYYLGERELHQNSAQPKLSRNEEVSQLAQTVEALARQVNELTDMVAEAHITQPDHSPKVAQQTSSPATSTRPLQDEHQSRLAAQDAAVEFLSLAHGVSDISEEDLTIAEEAVARLSAPQREQAADRLIIAINNGEVPFAVAEKLLPLL